MIDKVVIRDNLGESVAVIDATVEVRRAMWSYLQSLVRRIDTFVCFDESCVPQGLPVIETLEELREFCKANPNIWE